ncbi:MAG: hypothetical protein ACYDDO_06230 [Acidiferrobacterales bacterium]
MLVRHPVHHGVTAIPRKNAQTPDKIDGRFRVTLRSEPGNSRVEKGCRPMPTL